jgi:hypothetical protein
MKMVRRPAPYILWAFHGISAAAARMFSENQLFPGDAIFSAHCSFSGCFDRL